MSIDGKLKRPILRDDRSTVTQLLAAAGTDSDPVSVFMAGCTVADTEAAIFVVKGRENIAYLRSLCERQGLLTDKPVAGVTNKVTPNAQDQATAVGGSPGAQSWAANTVETKNDST